MASGIKVYKARYLRILSTTFVLLLAPYLALAHQAVLDSDLSGSITDDILAAAHNANLTKTCNSCRALLVPFQRLAKLGDENFVSAVVRICKFRKLADPDVCEGDIAAQGPIIAHSLRSISMNGRTAQLLCNTLFGMCDIVPTAPYNITFPPSEGAGSLRPKQLSQGRSTFQVVHLSDVHIDRDYKVGSEADCSKYICCRDFESEEESRNITEPAEPFGNPRCDSPARLANSMLQAMKEHVPNARFTISSGDVVDHSNWLLTQSTVEDELHAFHEQLLANLSTFNTFYGSVGNHDTYPTNDFPRTSSSEANGTEWLYDLMSNDWQPWIGERSASTVRHKSGSYAVVHPGMNLKLISINTQYWYKFNFWLYDSDEFQPDPNGLLEFLVSELHAAERADQRAWIFGHIPPGSSDTMRDQSNYYDQIVHRYRNIITAQFFGHTHFDQFQIAYTNYSDRTSENAMSFGLIAPSLTPTNGNPAFTVYDVDPDTYDIMDVKVYIANMSVPSYQTHPKWELYYSARDSYGPLVASMNHTTNSISTKGNKIDLPPGTPLDASFWHNLTEVFVKDNATFNLYINRTHRHAPPPIGGRECRDRCKDVTICDIRAMRTEDSCYTQSLRDMIPDGLPEPNQEFPELDVHNACEGSTVPLMMRRLVSGGIDEV